MTAIDNVVAYQEGQGEARFQTHPDLFAFMGADNGFLSLMGGKGIKSVGALRGRKLSVDAMTTGYALRAARAAREERHRRVRRPLRARGRRVVRFQELIKGSHAGTSWSRRSISSPSGRAMRSSRALPTSSAPTRAWWPRRAAPGRARMKPGGRLRARVARGRSLSIRAREPGDRRSAAGGERAGDDARARETIAAGAARREARFLQGSRGGHEGTRDGARAALEIPRAAKAAVGSDEVRRRTYAKKAEAR